MPVITAGEHLYRVAGAEVQRGIRVRAGILESAACSERRYQKMRAHCCCRSGPVAMDPREGEVAEYDDHDQRSERNQSFRQCDDRKQLSDGAVEFGGQKH